MIRSILKEIRDVLLHLVSIHSKICIIAKNHRMLGSLRLEKTPKIINPHPGNQSRAPSATSRHSLNPNIKMGQFPAGTEQFPAGEGTIPNWGWDNSCCCHLQEAKQIPTHRSKHDPENQPAEAPDDNPGRRRALGQAGQAPEGAQEYSQESCLQELGFPSCRREEGNHYGASAGSYPRIKLKWKY